MKFIKVGVLFVQLDFFFKLCNLMSDSNNLVLISKLCSFLFDLPIIWDNFQVPNPLFDLAGIMCGQFGIPFWKFFLATVIGKAIIKTHLQVCYVPFVTAFSIYAIS